GLAFEEAARLIAGREACLSLAGSNSPSTTVLSGDPDAINALVSELESQGVFCRILPEVDVAFHSYQMEPLVEPLKAALQDLRPRSTRYPLYSSVTGELIAGEELDSSYWGRNLRRPFLFARTAERLLQDGFTHFLEVSPHPVLTGAIAQTMKQAEASGLLLGSLSREKPELAALYATLGQLYTSGYPLNWPAIFPVGRFVEDLPLYPWQRERYWFDQLPGLGVVLNILNGKTLRVDYTSNRQLADGRPELHPLLGHEIALSLPGAGQLFQVLLSASSPDYLEDHKVQQKVWLPGAAYLEMALAASHLLNPGQAVLEDSRFHQGLLLSASEPTTVQVALLPESDERLRYRIASKTLTSDVGATDWTLHASGTILRHPAEQAARSANLGQIKARCTEEVSGEAHYAAMAGRGLHYGPAFQTIQRIRRRKGEALGLIELSSKLKKDTASYRAHPALLDAAFQLVAAALPGENAAGAVAATYLPESIHELRLYRPLPERLWCRVVLNASPDEDEEESSDYLSANFYLYTEDGQLAASGHGFNLKRVRPLQAPAQAQNKAEQNWHEWLYCYEWEAAEIPAELLPALSEQRGSWLIFSDQDAVGLTLAGLLEGRGDSAFLIFQAAGYSFDSAAGRAYLNPACPQDFMHLLDDLRAATAAEKLNLQGAVYLWGGEIKAAPETGEVSWEESLATGCYGLTGLVQALVKGQASLARLCLVTAGSQPVETVPDNLALAQAAVWGLGGSIANEHLEFNCLRVDLSRSPGQDEIEGLFAELIAANSGEQVVLRQAKRYQLRLTPYLPVASQQEEYSCDPDGAYLITGGLGGLGLVMAEHLIQGGARHLVLTGRSEPSEEAAARLTQWQSDGLDVRYARADAASPEQLQAVLDELKAADLPLRGLIHSALVLDDAMVVNLTPEHYQKVLASKLYGSWNLHRLTLEEPLDFFLLFSSVATVIGSPGQGNYVAGNAFVDELAHYRQALGLPATAISWPAWEEVGFAARSGAASRLENVGMLSIKPQQGLEVVDLVLREDPAHLIVINARWERVSKGNLIGAVLSANLRQSSSEQVIIQPESSKTMLAKLDRQGQQGFFEKYLIRMLSEILNCPAERLDTSMTLYNLGLDSLIAVSMKNELENDLKVSVPMETIMQGPSIGELAGQLVKLLGDSGKKAGVN
ncbi:MAG TPA: SDR family NAD(P)-dependent oxidoreductase, partial [Chloroflexia bacterium]|nr:SDR family NAD(P)-dependent oxidoreductase [Chloroflexia bacterium]